MTRRTTAMAIVLAAAATAGTAAFQQSADQNNQPGHATFANVWVQNRQPGEAIPATLVGHSIIALEAGTLVNTRADVQSWLYRAITVKAGEDVAAALATAGVEGWEAVGVTSATAERSVVLLKKPRQ
jgi:hypothetical protein